MYRFIVNAFVLTLISAGAYAYDVSDLIRDAKAYHSGHLAELGDMTVEMEGKFTAGAANNSSMKSKHYRKGDKWRVEGEMSMGSGQPLQTTMIYDGKDYWSVAMGMKTKLPEGQMPNQSEMNSYWSEPPEGSKIAGEETVGGRDCWIVEYPENKMMESPPRYWVDKEKFVFVRAESMLSGKEIRTEMSDFRTVKDEFEVPYHFDVYSDDEKSMEGDITKLEIGTGLSDDLFDAAKLEGGGMQNIDIDALMKQAEEMQKKAEEMQKQQQGGN